ncbi:FMRFamide receptor-like [Saccostrea cucullata]|uniref:FMRFamide receptor-like n=1 Tax=Saccostrea cuccullata TaxID=36930 RepID=UPI002ED1EFB9
MQNSTNLTDDEEYKDFYETSQFICGMILYPVICIPGLVGNALSLIVLSMKNMKTSTNAFLAALAISDSIKLINDLIYFIVLVLQRTNPAAAIIAYVNIYPSAHFIFNISTCVSSWLTVSVATERFILVCYPIKAKTMCTRLRAIVISCVIYLVMISISLPCAFRYEKTVKIVDNITELDLNVTELWRNEDFKMYYTWSLNFLRSNIVLIILIILNACIIFSLRKVRANKKNTQRNRITLMMIVVIMVFVICILPDAIMSVLGLGYHEGTYLERGIREFSDTLLTINAAVNFLIYCVFSRTFRQNFMILLPHCPFKNPDNGKQASYKIVAAKETTVQDAQSV